MSVDLIYICSLLYSQCKLKNKKNFLAFLLNNKDYGILYLNVGSFSHDIIELIESEFIS